MRHPSAFCESGTVIVDPRPELLVLRTLKLGDLLVAVPAIHGLRRAYPEHRLTLAMPGWLRPIVDLVGGVDELLPTPGLDHPLARDPGAVDVAVNLHGSGGESRDLIRLLGAREVIAHSHEGSPGPLWRDGMLERERWTRLVNAFGVEADPDDVGLLPPPAEPVVAGATVVHVGAFYGSRRWPVHRFADVAARLTADGRRVVLTGSAAERERALAVADAAGLPPRNVLAGELELGAFAGVVHSASVVISADTGAAHLASAYGTPSVVLFGPAPPEEWGPPATGPHVVLTDASLRRGDTFGDECDPAMLAVTADDVLEAARSLAGAAEG